MGEAGSKASRTQSVLSDERTADLVPPLADGRATDPAVTGSTAAAVAKAATANIATLPGAALTTAFAADIDDGVDLAGHPALQRAFDLGGGRDQALVARSSSVLEDTAGSSMAGQFESIIGITGFAELVDAVR